MFKLTDFQWKMMFGFSIVLNILIMYLVSALFTVDPKTSPGLDQILHTMEMLASGFIGWMAGHGSDIKQALGLKSSDPAPTISSPAPKE
jgi:hypothetical protein